MELSRIILLILKQESGKLRLSELFSRILIHPAFQKLRTRPSNTYIAHKIDVLVYDEYIIKAMNADEYQLSTKGYNRLKSWYDPQKVLNLISTDVAKILTIIATILSIVATYFTIKSRLS